LRNVEQLFKGLQQSKFRSGFKLNPKDLAYLQAKGLDVVRTHAEDFVAKRLAPADIPNDGKQTPMRGHPVFVAQHATATCCRSCLQKWHSIPQGKMLTQDEQAYIVRVIAYWLQKH
jgi:uncharacterized protein DUF4186